LHEILHLLLERGKEKKKSVSIDGKKGIQTYEGKGSTKN